MAGKNQGVCHSCRKEGHFFAECPRKRHCPLCKHAFVKCFEVEKESDNKGRLFNSCSEKCGYWEWVRTPETSGESSAAKDISSMFETLCRLTDEQNVEISMNFTFRKGRASAEEDKRGKGNA